MRIDEPIIAISIGISRLPELEALRPWTICMNVGRNMIEPNMPTPERNSTVMLAEKLRSAKSVTSRIGSEALQLADDERGERERREAEQAQDRPEPHG